MEHQICCLTSAFVYACSVRASFDCSLKNIAAIEAICFPACALCDCFLARAAAVAVVAAAVAAVAAVAAASDH